jgi:Mor family transcriptional regulator
MSKNTIELVDVLREELHAAGICYGVDRTDDLTENVLRRVVTRVGGLTVYVRRNVQSRSEVQAAVWAEFNGSNAQEIARRRGLSMRTVYRMIEAQRDLQVKQSR